MTQDWVKFNQYFFGFVSGGPIRQARPIEFQGIQSSDTIKVDILVWK